MSPGRFERKTCSISVEPMPSTMAQPKWRSKRWPISPGSASPADEHMRRATAPFAGRAGDASMPAKPVGAPKKTVGRRSCPAPAAALALPVQRLNTASGVGRSAISTTLAPTESGKVSALPSPYAK